MLVHRGVDSLNKYIQYLLNEIQFESSTSAY